MSESTDRSRLGSQRSSWRRDLPQLAWWFGGVLALTALTKWWIIEESYRGGMAEALAQLRAGGSRWPGFVIVPAAFGRDALETLLLVVLIYIVACRLMRVPLRITVLTATLLLGLHTLANLVCFSELASFVSWPTLSITIDWVTGDPDVLAMWVRKRNLAVLFLALCVSAALAFLPGRNRSSPRIAWPRKASLGVAFACALAAAGYASARISVPGRSVLLEGYWSESARSMVGLKVQTPLDGETRPRHELIADYESLAYRGLGPPAGVGLLPEAAQRRHVIVIGLETAPRVYYPMGSDPALAATRRMAGRGIVGQAHHSTTPTTSHSVSSIISGTYPAGPRHLGMFGDFETDSLPRVLAQRGYQTLYVDSYYVNWHSRDTYRRTLQSFGFDRIVDRRDLGDTRERSFEVLLDVEKRSFQAIRENVLQAERRDRGSFGFLMTCLGHHPWRAPIDQAGKSGRERIAGLAQTMDGLIGELIDELEQAGLEDELIVVVTGDHGLRYGMEFDSLDHELGHSNLQFHVPLVVYAPSIFTEAVEVNQVTSHVDIAPTIFALLGIDRTGMLHHGTSVLDPRLDSRMTFTLGLGLTPWNGLHRNGVHVIHNRLTDVTMMSRRADRSSPEAWDALDPLDDRLPRELLDARATIERAKSLFREAGGVSLRARVEALADN